MGCRPVLAIDSCHLSGPYKRALLSCGRSENYEDWYWFLEKLKGNHAYCYRHVKENFSSFLNKQNIRGKKGKEDVLLLLDNIVLLVEKLEVVRDLQFGGLLNLNCKEIRHNICLWLIDHFNIGFRCIDISFDKSYDLTVANVGLVFGLPTIGRILQIASTPSNYPFDTLNTCEERLLNLPVGEEFHRCFLYYACATILAPTSRIDGCQNLWHTIHEDGFRNDVNWGQFVVDQLVEGIRRFKQWNSVWLHYVIKFKIPSVHVPMTVPLLSAWLDELIKERLATEISEFGSFGHGELGIMRGLMHRLDARRERSIPSPAAGHSADEEVVVSDHFPLRSMIMAPFDRSGRRRRVRRMAPNLLSPFIMDLKQAAAIVFDGDLDPSEKLVSMHDTSLSRGNLVVDTYCRMLQFDNVSRTKLFLSPYIVEMVMCSNAKHLTHDAVIARFEPYLYPLDVYLPVLVKNHWTLYVYDLHNKRIQLLDSRPGRKMSCISGIQQNLVVLWLVAYKKEMVDVDFKMFRFVMPDVPCQLNDNNYGVFIMKFMDNWSNGGLSKSIDVGKTKKYRLKIMGRLLFSSHNAHRHRFMVD
ncbi:hypothetical protein AAG906_026620 [Vitis piasezkii]